MKIRVVPYQSDWKSRYAALREELMCLLHDLHPTIEHIGSTSVPQLTAKPIIDISVGVADASAFDTVVARFADRPEYIYFQVFNDTMPQRRMFLRLQEPAAALGLPTVFTTLEEIPHAAINDLRIAHIHVWEFGTHDWIRHLAFRDYLRTHPDVREAYASLKRRLSESDWQHGMAYNDAKDSFIKEHEKKALAWYRDSQP